MTFDPSIPGQITLRIESAGAWLFLRDLIRDSDGHLADELGELMSAQDEMWDEIVVPELADFFIDQRKTVEKIILNSYRAADGNSGTIVIEKDSAEMWYGVLNQAQLQLEERYHFGPRHHIRVEGLKDAEKKAFMRQQLYSSFQSLLLKKLMD